MSQKTPTFSSHFPSTWIVTEENEDGSSSPRAVTPIPPTETTPHTDSFLTSTPPTDTFPGIASSLIPASNATPTPSKYSTYFPSSWALPRSPSPTPSPRRLSPVAAPKTTRDISDPFLKQRSPTAFNLGPQIALWERLSKAQSFSLPRENENEDRLENLRKSVSTHLSQFLRHESPKSWGEQQIQSWHPNVGASSVQEVLQGNSRNLTMRTEEGRDEHDSDEEMVDGNEDDASYDARYGDAPHRAPTNDDAYSTRMSSGATD
jgi:hypothetical protein